MAERWPIPLDMEPMLAAVQPAVPSGEQWSYEPKWDGFRTLVFMDQDGVELVSRGAKSMTRYFPEILDPLRAVRAESCVLDGELILITRDGLDFDALQQRLHPAASRVRMLSEATPVAFVAFDLLAIDGEDLRSQPLSDRRRRLESVLEKVKPPVHMTPYTRSEAQAVEWLAAFEGAGLDGVIAKGWTTPYVAGKRGWVKIKHERTADCVVIGYRLGNDGESLGSLLLGLYDESGMLHYVGHTSSFDAATRRRLITELEPLREGAPQPEGRRPGGPSRWSQGRDSQWVNLRPELVCEVAFDKLQAGQRFRHAAGFRRWRPDKVPAQCGFEQVESVAAFDVGEILRG